MGVLHCRQTRTEARPQATCTERFGHTVFETWVRGLDRHRDMLIATGDATDRHNLPSNRNISICQWLSRDPKLNFMTHGAYA